MEIKLSVINESILHRPEEFVAECEGEYYEQVHKIADYIRAHYKERPIVLLSGPSGSGKTTTAHLLEKLLDAGGHETHTISMDNYFIPLSPQEQQLAAEKKLDLESPNRLDKPLLNAQLESILKGERVEIPTYDFTTSDRVYKGDTLTRGPSEIVIFEGIHALNPDVIRLPEENTVRIYISVRTRIRNNEPLHPCRIRLMRRMLRDRVGRARPVGDTLNMFDSVQRGEDLYIMPYKHHAMFDVDTLIPYEIGVYKMELLQELAALPSSAAVSDLIALLENTAPLAASLVPDNSLIQEFI